MTLTPEGRIAAAAARSAVADGRDVGPNTAAVLLAELERLCVADGRFGPFGGEGGLPTPAEMRAAGERLGYIPRMAERTPPMPGVPGAPGVVELTGERLCEEVRRIRLARIGVDPDAAGGLPFAELPESERQVWEDCAQVARLVVRRG